VQRTETDAKGLERFLERLDQASTHYEVLNIETDASPNEIKKSYYEVARRYHPDLFRKESDPDQNLRIESAFARVTQAYDTLREPGLRATYDSKLDALARARSKEDSAKPPAASGASSSQEGAADRFEARASLLLTDADRAELSFTEGLAAKQRGQLNTAIGMFSSAARLVPHDARYRAHYGQALASHASTRRLAEAEIQAAVKIEPENTDYRFMLAELYRDLGFALRAKAELEKILKVSPNHRKARQLLRRL
jgi:curved DNA-binding protein CbpA